MRKSHLAIGLIFLVGAHFPAAQTAEDKVEFCTDSPAAPTAYFRIPCVDDAYEAFQKAKAESWIRVGAGAYHWWNVNRETGDETYGFPGSPGTYFYYLNIDADYREAPEAEPEIGFHVQARWRDGSLFRPFFTNREWLYESYAFVDTPAGILKAGKVRSRIGFDWDNSFWGNVPYFDGYKLDPDWGVSLESTWQPSERLSLESFAQFFFAEDKVNGSLAGGDAESASHYDEDNTFIARLAPRYKLADDFDIYGGVGGAIGRIKDRRELATRNDETIKTWVFDLGFEKAGFNLFGEILQSYGVRNPAHYASGGASDESQTLYFGANYQWGPTLLRTSYSRGDYDNPGGEQHIYVVGADVGLTQYITLIFEYVNWTVKPDGGRTAKFEDGFEFVLNWNI